MTESNSEKPIEIYSHQSAMAQAPVPYLLFGKWVYIKPLSERDCMELDNFIRSQYLQSAISSTTYLSREAALKLTAAAKDKAITLTYRFGEGHELLFSSQFNYSTLIWHFTRRSTPSLDIQTITALCFQDSNAPVTSDHRLAYYDLSASVFRAIPPPPPNVFSKKTAEKPSFLPTLEEEAVVRLYKALAEKYHYTPDQISDLTHYQQYWLLFVTPEEIAARQELEMSLRKNVNTVQGGKIQAPPPPRPSGTVQMSVADWEAFQSNR